MTKKIYWESLAPEAEVEVLSCVWLESGGGALRLDATPFHPQGGGQPSDIGRIGDAVVIRVELDDGELIHYTDRPVLPGKAWAVIDVTWREKNSRLHSAGHLIGHALESIKWAPVKAHHWPGEGRVVCVAREGAASVDLNTVQRLCDELISQDLPCEIRVSESGYREVGFGDLAPYGCGGTHVSSTGKLEGLCVLSTELKKGKLSIFYEID
ncbi:Ser-tRNA(Ala) deacylase AlaX (editing enzyme) [Atopomonas hussainii]|uniref:Ser-tRNA(Ala) deacylase AlaX (Editing enzyme) n=1 Tax=Atopomonas hussainii TaxID=1429083 RepID=A0A1H7TCK9_9GAMM|nr:hypothetical protein [Atopomonas hussainii]SEL82174.1 Ser-tRNA(Ala) deacylase AlaX (editing enzyme) [Atopomonas hussainii]